MSTKPQTLTSPDSTRLHPQEMVGLVVGFTGTRKGMTTYQKIVFQKTLNSYHPNKFVHGGALGADCEAADYAHILGILLECYPARIGYVPHRGEVVHPVNEPLARNRDIVKSCDILIATPGEHEEVVRSGTWSTVRFARKVFRQIILILPDGARRHEQINLRNTPPGKRGTSTGVQE